MPPTAPRQVFGVANSLLGVLNRFLNGIGFAATGSVATSKNGAL
jgi:hypothetical protein